MMLDNISERHIFRKNLKNQQKYSKDYFDLDHVSYRQPPGFHQNLVYRIIEDKALKYFEEIKLPNVQLKTSVYHFS